jgi:hypothetical protein
MVAGETFAPLIERLYQAPASPVTLDLNLRSAYDSTQVLVDAALANTLGATAAGDSASLQIPVMSTGTITVKVVGYRDGTAHPGPDKTLDVFAATPQYEYANDFNSATSDFSGNGFTIGGAAGFSSNAIHSPHPYADETTLKYQLVIPIVVASDVPFVEYDDVAIVEPGDPGTVFGDGNFWDYVLVEGSLDGLDWTPIAPGYDAGLFPDWTSAYNSGTPGNSGMFHHHTFDLTSAFSPGDVIFLRFRLYADQAVNGWGWAIDNLEIQTGTVSSAPAIASNGLSLAQNSPNPFRRSTDIAFSLAREGRAELRVYDVGGRLVQTLIDDTLPAGPHTVRFERPATGSGVFFYKLTADGKTMSRKMVLLR